MIPKLEFPEKLPLLPRLLYWFRTWIDGLLRSWLPDLFPPEPVSAIHSFSPLAGYAGTRVTISGEHFHPDVAGNQVKIASQPAHVVSASPTEIVALVGKGATTDRVVVTADGETATSAVDFQILPYPAPGSGEDGPPILFEGTGIPAQGISPTGTMDILVSLTAPSDEIPTNPGTARNDVVAIWDNVKTFYEQASFGDLTVNIDVTSTWKTLSGDRNTYIDAAINNISLDVINRFVAEAAQGAVDDGKDLDDYDMLVCVIYLDGSFIRAWGNWTQTNFEYEPEGIDLTVANPLPLVAIQESANWGRCAHETGHNIIDAPGATLDGTDGATLGEDVYDSDLIDPTAATAEVFEMMGDHNSHPLFSGFYMEQMGYYDTNNTRHVRHLNWDRNPTSTTFDIVAHGLSRNNLADRCHLVKLKVTEGLFYFIEVRQRPGTTAQIFDDNIPVGGAPHDGGVVVTKVLTDVVNMNQQMRFITLLHDQVVLKAGESAVDPVRTIQITVENDGLVSHPLACRVQVAWAQDIDDTPEGAFDLRLEPWDSHWQTPDIWVDRNPFGTFDNAADAEGRPRGNGDKPQVNEINHFFARVHNDGTDKAQNVQVTFYSVEPPGVGDNGNWAPLETVPVADIDAGDFEDVNVNWVPVVDRHTCLKVYVGQQLGEVTGGNNQAQENVFEFEAAAASIPSAVTMSVAVRNPLDKPTIVLMAITGVPQGYLVQFPHRWLWMKAKEERKFTLTILPTEDYYWYREVHKENLTASIGLVGYIPRTYERKIPFGVFPASRMFPIGGVTANITPKHRVAIEISAEGGKGEIFVQGSIAPGAAGEIVRVDATDHFGYRRSVLTTTAGSGAFSAEVLVRTGPQDPAELPSGHPGQFPLPGVYQVQARIINSPNAAQAESNIVYVNVT